LCIKLRPVPSSPTWFDEYSSYISCSDGDFVDTSAIVKGADQFVSIFSTNGRDHPFGDISLFFISRGWWPRAKPFCQKDNQTQLHNETTGQIPNQHEQEREPECHIYVTRETH
jgi:hypothetical protein